MTRVTLLFFAALRELVGTQEVAVELPAVELTPAQLLREVERVVPVLQGRLEQVRVAHNEVFVDTTLRLKDGDVLALIPPVAGG